MISRAPPLFANRFERVGLRLSGLARWRPSRFAPAFDRTLQADHLRFALGTTRAELSQDEASCAWIDQALTVLAQSPRGLASPAKADSLSHLVADPPSAVREAFERFEREHPDRQAFTVVPFKARAMDATQGSFTRRTGYSPEARKLDPAEPHTIDDVEAYAAARYSSAVLGMLREGESLVELHRSSVDDAARDLAARGFKIQGELVTPRQKLHRRILVASQGGQRRFAVAGMAGEDRLFHMQAYLRHTGVPAGQVVRVEPRGIAEDGVYDAFVHDLTAKGAPPEQVLIGFVNGVKNALLPELENARIEGTDGAPETARLKQLDVIYRSADNTEGRLRVLPSPYGDEASALVRALKDTGVKDVLWLNAAGSLADHHALGDTVVPDKVLRADGSALPFDNNVLHRLSAEVIHDVIPGAHTTGSIAAVPSVLTETTALLNALKSNGTDLVDVESRHLVQGLQEAPDLRLGVMQLVSDRPLDGAPLDATGVQSAVEGALGPAVQLAKSYFGIEQPLALSTPGRDD